jgi:hypothetical protein
MGTASPFAEASADRCRAPTAEPNATTGSDINVLFTLNSTATVLPVVAGEPVTADSEMAGDKKSNRHGDGLAGGGR